mmetsp:Transcript_884/g.1521  ORF Transcript_884/g.1521 Transcript_884/m.1521 type:complete len:121 (+) Transcript_884:254-616(+)
MLSSWLRARNTFYTFRLPLSSDSYTVEPFAKIGDIGFVLIIVTLDISFFILHMIEMNGKKAPTKHTALNLWSVLKSPMVGKKGADDKLHVFEIERSIGLDHLRLDGLLELLSHFLRFLSP